MSATFERPARIKNAEEVLILWQSWSSAAEPAKAQALVPLLQSLDPMIRFSAERYRYRSWLVLEFEEAYSIGRIAVLRHLDRYHPERAWSLLRFAYLHVKWGLAGTFKTLRRSVRIAEPPIGKDPEGWEDPFVALTERTASFCFADTRAVTEFRLAIETYRAYARELNASALGEEVLRRLVEEGQPPTVIYGELYRNGKQAPPILLSKLLSAAVSLLHGALGGNRLSVRANTLERGAGCKWHQTQRRKRTKSVIAEQS
jgi:hypothetical protein